MQFGKDATAKSVRGSRCGGDRRSRGRWSLTVLGAIGVVMSCAAMTGPSTGSLAGSLAGPSAGHGDQAQVSTVADGQLAARVITAAWLNTDTMGRQLTSGQGKQPTPMISRMLPIDSVLPGQVPTGQPSSSTPGQGSSQPESGPVVYLTFDDGPDQLWTPQILALLAKYDAQATFFHIGRNIREHPTVAAQVRAAGHPVGNHTANHARLTRLDSAGVRRELAGGVPQAACMRPPFGRLNGVVRAEAAAAGQQVVMWTVDTRDWARPGAASIQQALLTEVTPGAVVLMHDGGGDRGQTFAALTEALPVLAARGYRFVGYPGC